MSDMKYEGNKGTLTMEEIEEILTDRYGDSEYARESGCNTDGGWLSINEILETLADQV